MAKRRRSPKSCAKRRVKIGRRTFMAKPSGCGGPKRKRKLPAALRVWSTAAKKCPGKVGSAKKTSCMKQYVRSH